MTRVDDDSEALRQKLLARIEEWSFAPTPDEAAIVAAVDDLPVVIVKKVSAEQIAFMRMPDGQCHANADWYARNDPSGRWKMVSGWMHGGDAYVLHSIISDGENYLCLTPFLTVDDEYFPFVPDTALCWQDGADGFRHCTRNGVEIGVGVRLHPKAMIAKLTSLKEKLVAGIDPMTAVEGLM